MTGAAVRRSEPGEVPEAAAREGAARAAAAKWAKRVERGNAEVPEPSGPIRDQSAVLAELADLHARFEAGGMSFEDFEATKQELTEQLDVR